MKKKRWRHDDLAGRYSVFLNDEPASAFAWAIALIGLPLNVFLIGFMKWNLGRQIILKKDEIFMLGILLF
ncbi:hypothetical protein TrispH2_006320 [Trichoplax sp. H2]|nr:hypothetical protein TrispH2_006320 [Trichoplax sp. H2]|eukprot:RDD41811.1 hypothetical protein TrispH2_006320 [Trichoplax sp. H2]